MYYADGVARGASADQYHHSTTSYNHHISPTTSSIQTGYKSRTDASAVDGAPPPPEVSEEDFDFLGPLGRGASSVVVGARHAPSGMIFALKRISRASIWRNPALNKRVRFEINVHRLLRHPNVVRLHTYYVTPTELVLVLEHCERGSLHGKLQSTPNGVFDESRAARYTRQIVRGVAYLHSKGVLHRDLKLENILLDFEGRVKVADFGLAWQQAAADDCQSPTRGSSQAGGGGGGGSSEGGGGFFGTLDYLAPETILRHHYSPKSDVWAVGVMLAEMVGGTPPFYQPSEKASMAAIVHGQPTIPTWNALSASCQNFLQLVLDKDPGSRPDAEVLLRHPFLASSAFTMDGGPSIDFSA